MSALRVLVLGLGVVALSACASNGTGGRFGRGLVDAAAQPLEDLNLRQDPIPAVLGESLANPYSQRGMETCMAIALQVRHLNEALGPDQDEPPPPRAGLSQQAVEALDVRVVELGELLE